MNIKKGKQRLAPRLLIYGQEKIGKSTFAANAPRPIILDIEKGLGEIDCERVECETYQDVYESLDWLASNEHPYETVVIDSADWLEKRLWDGVSAAHKVKSIELVLGGYGKGFTVAVDWWRPLLSILDTLRLKGIGSIFLAHCEVKKFEDPESPPYDQFGPRLHKYARALLTEWADAVMFATRKIRVQTEEGGFGKSRSTAVPVGREEGGDRILRTVGGPACIAGNRYGLPDEIKLDWNEFVKHLT